VLGLDPLPFVPMPPIPFDPTEKAPAIEAYIGDRPAAWLDDLIGDEARQWAEQRPGKRSLTRH
jgi:hypothetical protein